MTDNGTDNGDRFIYRYTCCQYLHPTVTHFFIPMLRLYNTNISEDSQR